MACIDRSLARLQTSYVDLYQIHAWDAQTAVESWMATLADLVQAGKIRAIGISNVTGWQLQKIVTVAASLGVLKAVAPQNSDSDTEYFQSL